MESVIVLGFDATEQAYDGFRSLHRLHAEGGVQLKAAAVAERRDNGRIVVLEVSEDSHAPGAPAAGAIGTMLGLAAAPVGAIADDRDHTLGKFGRALPAGSTATLAIVEEATPEAVDAVGNRLGATLLRGPRRALELELAEAEAAANAATGIHLASRTRLGQR